MEKKLDLARWAKDIALKNGASQTKVDIYSQREANVEVRDKKIDKLLESTSSSLNISIYVDNKYSSQSTNDLRRSEVEKFIKDAIAATKYLAKDEYRSLPDPRFYKTLDVDLKITDGKYSEIDSAEKIRIAQEMEATALPLSDKIISVSTYFSDGLYESATVLSNGFEGENKSTYFSVGTSISIKDPNGARPGAWKGINSRFFNRLTDPKQLAKEAVDRALKKIGMKKIASGKYDMIIKNETVSRLLSMLMSPMSGWAIQQKRSFLEGKIGQKLFSEKLTVIDDPLLIGGLGSQLYDGDGIASRKLVMVENGVLKNFYIDNYYGKKLNMEPTTGGATNLVFSNGTESLEELIKKTQKGILVEGFNGGNSNSTTGDFSYGIEGMLIENGKVTQPVNEMIVSGNALDLWMALAEVGNDPYPYSSRLTPSLLFKDIDFGGL